MLDQRYDIINLSLCDGLVHMFCEDGRVNRCPELHLAGKRVAIAASAVIPPLHHLEDGQRPEVKNTSLANLNNLNKLVWHDKLELFQCLN